MFSFQRQDHNNKVLATPDWEGDADFCSMDAKKIVYCQGGTELYYYDLVSGKKTPLEPEFQAKSITPVWSQVTGDIVFTRKRLLGWDVALYNSKTKEVRFLTEGADSCRGRWSHKGDRIAFVSGRADGKGDIWIMNADGSNQTRLTTTNDTHDYYPSWSPDDQYVAFTSSTHKTKGNWSLWIVDVKTGKTWKIYDTPGQEKFPAWTQ